MSTVNEVMQRMIERARDLANMPLTELRSIATDSESPQGGAPGKKSLRLEFAGKSKGDLVEWILDNEFEQDMETGKHIELVAAD